jgi:hypothetical protein
MGESERWLVAVGEKLGAPMILFDPTEYPRRVFRPAGAGVRNPVLSFFSYELSLADRSAEN